MRTFQSTATILVSLCVLSLTTAFAPRRPPCNTANTLASSSSSPRSLLTTTLSATPFLSPDHIDALSTAATHVQQHLVTTSTSSSTQWLADAAAVTVDATTTAARESTSTGWWQSYLNIFENTIKFVHSTIDPPLRNVGITQTWGISIAIFTASVRTLLVPLSIQQSKSTEYMKALKPYMNEIKEKFPDNEEMRNRVTAKLFEDAQQNPLAGCLVSLAQLPIFLGLYRGVRLLAIDGQLNEPFLWIPSLEGPVGPPNYRGLQWLTEGWTAPVDGSFLPTPSLGWETTLAFLIMPIILVLGQKLTMEVLQPADIADESSMSAEEKENADRTKNIFKFLPLLIGFFSLQVPAGLTIYWFTSNIFTLSQSLLARQYYAANPPDIKLPEYWDKMDKLDEMSADEQRQAAEAGLRAGPTFQDLQDESKFHYVVQRGPLRVESNAWKRVDPDSYQIPTEMAAWVGAAPTAASRSSSSSENVVVVAESDEATVQAETSAASS